VDLRNFAEMGGPMPPCKRGVECVGQKKKGEERSSSNGFRAGGHSYKRTIRRAYSGTPICAQKKLFVQERWGITWEKEKTFSFGQMYTKTGDRTGEQPRFFIETIAKISGRNHVKGETTLPLATTVPREAKKISPI